MDLVHKINLSLPCTLCAQALPLIHNLLKTKAVTFPALLRCQEQINPGTGHRGSWSWRLSYNKEQSLSQWDPLQGPGWDYFLLYLLVVSPTCLSSGCAWRAGWESHTSSGKNSGFNPIPCTFPGVVCTQTHLQCCPAQSTLINHRGEISIIPMWKGNKRLFHSCGSTKHTPDKVLPLPTLRGSCIYLKPHEESQKQF